MVFPFTFNITVPGISNPFAPAPPPIQTRNENSQDTAQSSTGDRLTRNRAGWQKITRPRPSPSPSPAPTSRKRGWEPSFAEPSRSTTTRASTSGYLDTPAKYRELARRNPDEYHDITMSDSPDHRGDEEEMPPMKRRRGFAGSIISTAVSAALIGSAVGLTVYRLWRDRGRLPPPGSDELPPPYQQGEWQKPVEQAASIRVTPPTPRSARKSRQQITSAPKRPVAYNRRPRAKLASPAPVAQAHFPSPKPEFNFAGAVEDEEEDQTPMEDQMDWIGDKLSMLIEQGKRALGTEVVVMSDAKEDEVDDGSGAWEEEHATRPASRTGSLKRAKRPRSIVAPSSSYTGIPIPSASPRRLAYEPSGSSAGSFTPGSAPVYASPRKMHTRGLSYEAPSPPSFVKEDPAAYESPEMRESMEKARARILAARSLRGT
ncbi:hypothetical protein B0H34DRAFT_705214 [Crassisporium funariophilum]|nr:hypothetical protein B0H34DRAFT_705214 [Crassisporium funariophilum]